jgi:succinate dehydrogenase/fumarate reductase flavoprotein subunit
MADVLEYDVVCVGAGGAGISAAITAAEVGARVLLISKDPIGYGSTRISMGLVASCGIDSGDGPAALYEDLLAGGEYLNNPKMARAVAEEARLCPAIAEDLGQLFQRDKDGGLSQTVTQRLGGHRYARTLAIPAHGVAIGQALRGAVARSAGDVREGTHTVTLLRDSGRIAGLVAWDMAAGETMVVRSPAVILATGGLGWMYYPHTDCTRSATGDGYALAYEAGAELVDMEQVQFLPFACTHPSSMVGIFLGEPAWAGPEGRLLDGRGQELLSGINRMTRAQVSRVMGLELQKGNGTAYGGLVLDLHPNLATADGRLAWQKMKDAGNLDAAKRAYGPGAYAWEEPWDVAPTAHFHMGGVRIDERGASSVRGLYSAGEAAGGLHGANRLGSVALAELFLLGRRAGAAAAEYALNLDRPNLSATEASAAIAGIEALLGAQDEHRPVALARTLQKLMWEKVGVVRSQEPLTNARAALDELNAMAGALRVGNTRRSNPELLDALELRSMLVTAQMVASSALRRLESRGAHVRLDYPDRDDEHWQANIVIRRQDDRMVLAVEPVGRASVPT